ncbi:MAG: hypothetical protein ACKO0Z_26835 [Betaproteobacteria bacterium]
MDDIIAIFSVIVSLFFMSVAISRLVSGDFSALWASLLGFFGLCIIDIAKYYYIDAEKVGWIGSEMYRWTSLWIWMALLLFIIAYAFTRRYAGASKIVQKKAISFEWRYGGATIWRLAKISILPLSLVVSAFSSGGSYLSVVLSGLGKGIPCTLVVVGLLIRDRTAVLVGLFSLIAGFSDSSRRAYIAIAIPIIITWLVSYSSSNFGREKKSRKKIKYITLASLAALFFFLNFLRSDHNFGEEYNPDDRMANTWSYITTLRSIDTFDNTAFIISNFPKNWNYYYGETFASILTSPIPRSWWSEKPAGFSAHLGLMRRLGYRGFDEDLWLSINQFSLSPGFVGEAYANFGFLGIIFGSIFWGSLAGVYDSRWPVKDVTVLSLPMLLMISAFMLVPRGDFFSALNYQIFLFVFSKIFILSMFRPTHSLRRTDWGTSKSRF